MNVFQIQWNPCLLDILITLSKVAVFWSNARKTDFLPENNSQKQRLSFRAFFFFFKMCKSIISKQVYCWQVLHNAALFSHFSTDFGYIFLAKTTSVPIPEKLKEKDKAPANVSFTSSKTHHRCLQKEWIFQAASFFSCRPKAIPRPIKMCILIPHTEIVKAFHSKEAYFRKAEVTGRKRSKKTPWEQNVS